MADEHGRGGSEMATCQECGGRFFSGFKRERPVCGICAPIDGGVKWGAIPRPTQLADREALAELRRPDTKPSPLRDGTQLWDADPSDE